MPLDLVQSDIVAGTIVEIGGAGGLLGGGLLRRPQGGAVLEEGRDAGSPVAWYELR